MSLLQQLAESAETLKVATDLKDSLESLALALSRDDSLVLDTIKEAAVDTSRAVSEFVIWKQTQWISKQADARYSRASELSLDTRNLINRLGQDTRFCAITKLGQSDWGCFMNIKDVEFFADARGLEVVGLEEEKHKDFEKVRSKLNCKLPSYLLLDYLLTCIYAGKESEHGNWARSMFQAWKYGMSVPANIKFKLHF